MKCGFVITAVLITTISSHAVEEVEPESSQATSKEISSKSAQETLERTDEESTVPVAVVEDSKTSSEYNTNVEQGPDQNAQQKSATAPQQDSDKKTQQKSATAPQQDFVRKVEQESATALEKDSVRKVEQESATALENDSVRKVEQESVTALEKDYVRGSEQESVKQTGQESVRAEQDDGATRIDRSTVSVLDTFEAERKSSSTTGDDSYTDKKSTLQVQSKNAAVEDATEKTSKQDEDLSVKKPEKEFDFGLKRAEHAENGFETKLEQRKDTKSNTDEAKVSPKSSKQGVDKDDSYEDKFGEDYSSTSSEPFEGSTVSGRRMLSPKIIDTKARSGFEANADEAGNIQVTEDDASEDVRSARPFDSPRQFIGGARYFPATLTRQLVRPKLLLKPIIRPVLPRFFEFPRPESYKLFQKPVYPKPSPLEEPKFKEFFPNSFEQKPYKNSYPYEAPLAHTSPNPFTYKFPSFDNLLPSPNLDKLFLKLSQASNIPKLNHGFPSLVQPSPAPFTLPSYLGYSQAT